MKFTLLHSKHITTILARSYIILVATYRCHCEYTAAVVIDRAYPKQLHCIFNRHESCIQRKPPVWDINRTKSLSVYVHLSVLSALNSLCSVSKIRCYVADALTYVTGLSANMPRRRRGRLFKPAALLLRSGIMFGFLLKHFLTKKQRNCYLTKQHNLEREICILRVCFT